MRKNRKLTILAAIFVVLIAQIIAAQTQKTDAPLKNQYKQIEVSKFDVKAGVDFPPEYPIGILYETVIALTRLNKFDRVLPEGETQTLADVPTLCLTGTVTEYQPGSRVKRYFIGLGAGKTNVVTHIKFIDKSTGKILYETDALGAVAFGYFGGEARLSLRSVGRKIAKITNSKFF